MQEDVENRAVALSIKTAKLTSKMLEAAIKKPLQRWRNGRKALLSTKENRALNIWYSKEPA